MSSDGGTDGANAPLLGHVVAERYFVEKHLGEGGMGTVYTARHVTLDKLVALKVLHGEFSRKEDLVERFLQEAKAASSIRNEHVIDITDFGVTAEGFVFFTMEYLEGKDLHTLLKEVVDAGGLLPWERSLNIFVQVCQALSAAHAKGIIHRDLKPENIFLVEGTGRSDYVKLLDFGIAKVESADADGERKLTKTGMLFGTPEYMAPEQARGEKPDHRVDVYAMGCLLFQFLVGTVPFKAESFMAILTQHMIEPVPEISPQLLARSGAPSGILKVVEKALAKDRDERYATIEALSKAAQEAQYEGTDTSAVPRARRQSTASKSMDWTGSVRGIDTLVEEEVAQEAEIARAEAARQNKSKLLIGAVAAIVLAGGGFAVSKLMSGSSERPAQPEAAPQANDSVEAPVEPAQPALVPSTTPTARTASATEAEVSETAAPTKPPADTTGAAATKPGLSVGKDKPVKTTQPGAQAGADKNNAPVHRAEATNTTKNSTDEETASTKVGTKPASDEDVEPKTDEAGGNPLDAPTIMRPEGL